MSSPQKLKGSLKGKVFVLGQKSSQITEITHLESLYTNINKHHILLRVNISPFGSSDKFFLPGEKGISPQSILLFDAVFMSSLCGVGVRVRVRVNNFSSKTTRPRDVLFFLKDTLSIEDEKLFKACKPVCSSVC